ncbi:MULTISPECIES: COG1470 family protein [Sphingobacterium]|uniref:COG1470 family protein n=1 Tax=Sphingobacterium TaxID=28453 RepID=UPI00097EAE9E|nr:MULTISPECIES: NEW3 domain-containing protein [Sphingobacterium]UPZ36873.1 NEW3 domain-containing protein [Sphingobacterium sp. PCS056]WGQ16101.1 NEW3 domain-containing protein [Sphingobacterium faecium]SJN49709.1 S-layer domain [Sphingobacterium faecium PCAi_F2.5]
MLNKLLITRLGLSFRPLFISFLILANSLYLSGQTVRATKSSFEARLLNIEAPSNEPFRYTTTLTNGSSQTVTYNLNAQLPEGWQISYRVEGSQVTSLQMQANKVQEINIEINCPLTAKPNTYKIPLKAISPTDTLHLDLEAVVKGSYALQLTTPSGRLSDEVVSGSNKEILLQVKNTGTLPLNAVELSAQLPSKWEATFSPSTIQQLEPGKSTDVKVDLRVPDKTIAGDYAAKFDVKSPNSTADISFRMIVKTSLLSGWVGMLIILLAIGLIYYLIRKYGRR